MNILKWLKVSTLFLVLTTAVSLYGYPAGLGTLGSIQASGSDPLSVQYNNFAVSSLAQYLSIEQPGGVNAPFLGGATGSPNTTVVSNITNVLNTGSPSYLVRFYFVSSSADYRNTIAFSPNTSLFPGQNAIIFPNANINASTLNPGDPNSPYGGLVAGQFVSIGEVPAGASTFNLALLANAANGSPLNTFWTTASANPDGIDHVKIVQFTGTDYYLIAWEDKPLSTSDLDFNDVIMVAEIIPLPEPSVYILGACALALVAFIKARKSLTTA